MKVLSLFDGISCGQVALNKLGFNIDKYDAFEIDKNAIKVTQKNYPNTIQHGDVFEGDFTQFKGYDLLIGGSPCFSAGTQICAKTKNGSKGYKEIQDIVKGDYVLTHKNRWRKVTSTMNHVAANACIVKIEGFKDFTISTLNHRYYTREVIINKETNEVTYGDYEWRQLSKFENYETAKETHRTHVCCPIKVFNAFAKNNFSNWWRDGNFALVPCENIIPIQNDKMVVYNLSVKDDESYVADGCIVHNCTYWSISKHNRETTPDGIGGKLFMEYVRALKESQCKYFLYENNNSIHQNIKDFISKQLGVTPIMINSALLSAQQRKRCYWTNIPNVRQPEDKGFVLADILEDYDAAMQSVKPIAVAQRGRYVDVNGKRITEQKIEIKDDDTKEKANCLTTVQKDSMVAVPIRLGGYGGCGQGQRIYSVRGKSVTLSANGGGLGAKTGLYKVDIPDGDYLIRKLTPVETERLQTLPDNYTEGIATTQRYKCIGNGWTVDVIAHILKEIKDEYTI